MARGGRWPSPRRAGSPASSATSARRTTAVVCRRPRQRTWTFCSVSPPSWATRSLALPGPCPSDKPVLRWRAISGFSFDGGRNGFANRVRPRCAFVELTRRRFQDGLGNEERVYAYLTQTLSHQDARDRI